MEKVIFLVYHGMGHLNACLGLARSLKSQFQVTLACDSFFENYVKAQGFYFHGLNSVPFGLGFEKWKVNNLKRSFRLVHELKYRKEDELYRLRYQDLMKLLHFWKPNYVLIDSLQSTDFIVIFNELKRRRIKVAFIQTMLSTVIAKGYPELNNPYNPQRPMAVRNFQKKAEWQWKLTSLLAKIKYLGYDNQFLVKRNFKRNNLPVRYYSKKRSVAGRAFNHVPELILAPEEFEYENYNRQSYQFHVGFALDNQRTEISDSRYLEVLEKIQRNVTECNHFLIYCSFGTVRPTTVKPLKTLLSKIVTLVSQKNRFSLIISSSVFNEFENGTNIFVLGAVPQVDLLNYVNIFITHGGLNSIKESINAEVPMIVYPVDTNHDQVGNAARVSYHGLGMMGSFNDTMDIIQMRFDKLLTDLTYIESLRKFKDYENKYSAEGVMKALETLE